MMMTVMMMMIMDEHDDSATSDRASLEMGFSCLVSELPKVMGKWFETCLSNSPTLQSSRVSE